MDANLKKANEIRIKHVIKNLEKRNMAGFYCETKKEAADKVLELLKDSKSVTWGGSMTLGEIGVKERLSETGLDILEPMQGYSADVLKDKRRCIAEADAFLMSTNAITMDGVLLNIDGVGNRVAALAFGPEKVIIVAGYNKITSDEDEAMKRVKGVAVPANGIRLSCKTPCVKTGICSDCTTDDCLCCTIVYTRCSRAKGRINVILVNEELGY